MKDSRTIALAYILAVVLLMTRAANIGSDYCTAVSELLMLKRRLLHVPKLWFIVYIDGIIRNLYNTSLVYVRNLFRPPQGGYNPQFSCDTPNHLKFKGGYQGGVYGGVYVIVMEWVINVVKY